MNTLGKNIELKEMPQLRYGNPALTLGKKYRIIDIEGSNFWIKDDDNNLVSLGRCRFYSHGEGIKKPYR